MKLSLITLNTPTRENYRGASALPYQLMNYRPKNCKVQIYSYNLNDVDEVIIGQIERELNVKIKILPKNKIFRLLSNRFLLILRVFLNYSVFHFLKLPQSTVKEIEANADNIWIYAEDIGHLSSLFNKSKKCVITTPDCEALYYNRVLSLPSKCTSFFKIFKYGRAYWQYLNVARSLPVENCRYHLVGWRDKEYLTAINPILDADFIPHPHYPYNTERIIKFNRPKIRLLIPGRYDFYSKEAIDCAISAIAEHPALASSYVITFQGRGWENCAKILESAGFDVVMKGFVPDYKDELCKHDIQLSPISLGTGTKGKVLDAFVNGLLVIGTFRAIENIQVENDKDFIYYDNPNILIDYLYDIPKNINKYEEMAKLGRDTVLRKHDARKIAEDFFKLFK